MNGDVNLYKRLYEEEKAAHQKTIKRYQQRKREVKDRQDKIFSVITCFVAVILLTGVLYIWLTGYDSLIEFFISI